MQTDTHFWPYLTQCLSEWQMFRTKVVDKTKTRILYSITFLFRKPCRFWGVEKYCRAGRATDVDMAHAHCMLYTKGCKHNLRICNTYFFSTCCMNAPQCYVTLTLTVLFKDQMRLFNPLNPELNLIFHLLALLGAHHIHVSRIRVKHYVPRILIAME